MARMTAKRDRRYEIGERLWKLRNRVVDESGDQAWRDLWTEWTRLHWSGTDEQIRGFERRLDEIETGVQR